MKGSKPVLRIEEGREDRRQRDIADAKTVLRDAEARLAEGEPQVLVVALLTDKAFWTDTWGVNTKNRLAGVGLAEFAKDGIMQRIRETSRRVDQLEPEPEEEVMEGTFGWAIKQMQDGAKVCRAGWNGKGQWLAIQNPDENSKMKKPYIYISPVDGELVPWLASQTDMLALDWELAE